MFYTSSLNKISFFVILIFLVGSCSDDEMPMNGGENEMYRFDCVSDCEAFNMECKDDICLCSTEEYYKSGPASFEDSLFCHPLNDLFYVRVDHEGDISNFEIMDVLKMPSSKASYDRPNSHLPDKPYPEQFIVELFSTRSGKVEFKDYSPLLYIYLLFENKSPNNADFPFLGYTENGYPSGYKGPKNTSELVYGLAYEWDIEVNEDTAVLKVKVYSAGEDAMFLDDEITMYYERYRE